ncbi:MAG: histidine kinase [Rhodocyclaceae bacterium]|nr:histidine kinase [Rhodocyclaceae bacterium]
MSSATPFSLLAVVHSQAAVVRLLDEWSKTSLPLPHIETAANVSTLRSLLRKGGWDAVLHWHLDAGCTAQTTLKHLRERQPDTPLILIAPLEAQDEAYRLLAAGVRDVIFADHLRQLPFVIAREKREASQQAEHRAALAMLHESEARFRALASNLPGLVFNLERKPEGKFRFLYVSEGALRLFGLKQHELRNAPQRFFAIFAAEDRARLLDALQRSGEEGQALLWEGKLATAERWIEIRAQPHRFDNGAVQWTGIASDISLSKATEAELRESRRQLADLSFHIEAVREEERERIARDIHDELGSLLVRTKIEASLLAGKLPPELAEKARSIEKLLDQAMATASRVARQLRPGILKEFGLAAAIECQAEDFAHSTGIACKAQCDEGIELEPDTALALFRIVQEALTNVAKHAHASLAVVRLRRENGNIVLEIRDNGRGIRESDMDKARSYGLRGIRERIERLKGSFQIMAGEQGGTLLLLRVPAQAVSEAPVQEQEETVQQDLF